MTEIDFYDIPEGKNCEDYPDDTSFKLNENAGPRFDKTAFIEKGKKVRLHPGEPGFDIAWTRTELYNYASKMRNKEK